MRRKNQSNIGIDPPIRCDVALRINFRRRICTLTNSANNVSVGFSILEMSPSAICKLREMVYLENHFFSRNPSQLLKSIEIERKDDDSNHAMIINKWLPSLKVGGC